ncbi:MAG TPA: cytochrome P450 [Stackebrandtia sp.]|jgi:cytochrome P450|uniref:cytochrome P450 n=1 Tax=Stackebrandtia sp. TaxID=2023065 RepID=UPI002D408B87|nr:cytochrome P450 [Stackebrandtia sp.]HZE39728.1 cytochrome P450 [Stackebrandtia sp.]
MSSTTSIPHGLPLERTGPFDPPAQLKDLRDHRPLSRMYYYPDEHLGWVITSHQLAKRVLADVRFSSEFERIYSSINLPGLDKVRDVPKQPGMFIRMDPPDHSRLRTMLTGVFTVRRMKQLEPRVLDIVTEHLDAMERAEKPVDLVQDFALPVPSMVICEMLGVPFADRGQFQRDSARLLSLKIPFDERTRSVDNIKEYIRGLAEDKRAHPGDDLLSDLASGGELTMEELEGIGFLLLIAGHETTANMLALGTFALLENPAQLDTLRADPQLMPGAVEELLRWLSIIHIGPVRRAAEDIDLDGTLIKRGEQITVSVPSANRDPERFDDPDALDVTRHANGHFAFGHGVHQCLGQQLARIEMRIGFNELIRRFPTLRLAVPASEVPMRTDMAIYGVHELPVTW